jgi:hypothetical protein
MESLRSKGVSVGNDLINRKLAPKRRRSSTPKNQSRLRNYAILPKKHIRSR